ncbi:MAG: hypothetical protein Q9224_003806, partial [Gallowayella concinna]
MRQPASAGDHRQLNAALWGAGRSARACKEWKTEDAAIRGGCFVLINGCDACSGRDDHSGLSQDEVEGRISAAPTPEIPVPLRQTSVNGSVLPVAIGPTSARKTLSLPAGVGFLAAPINSANSAGIPSSITQALLPSTTSTPRTADNSNSALPQNPSKIPSSTAKTTSATNQASNGTTSSGPNAGPSRHNSNSISPGAAAGIGIGCAVAGALIAAVIAAFILRRWRRRAPTRSEVIPLKGFASVEKSVASPDLSSPSGMIEQSLPQPAEDQALGGEMSRLRTTIKNHVQSYYHTNSVRGGVDQVALGSIATGNMPLISSTLGSLLSNPVTRVTAIRFCITWTVISRIDQNCEPNQSFLPPEIANCLFSISSTRDDPATKPGFMSRWRSLTAALLQDRYGSSNLTSSDPRNKSLSEALRALDAVLRPFADEQRDGRDRLQKLEEILKR